MKKTRFLSFFILLCLLLSAAAPGASALEEPTMTAQSWILIDLNTGEVIAEHNADEPRSPASLTKIMTGLLAVEAVAWRDRGETLEATWKHLSDMRHDMCQVFTVEDLKYLRNTDIEKYRTLIAELGLRK